MKVFRISLAAIAPVLVAATFSTAHAQATCGAVAAGTASCAPAGVNVTTTVLKIVRVTVSPASAALSAPVDADFNGAGNATKTDLALHSVVVRANVPWQITVNGAAWTAPYAKAVSDLEWTMNGGGAWNAMTATAASMQTGTATAGATVTIGYRTTWRLLNDLPGAYTMPLTFTMSST